MNEFAYGSNTVDDLNKVDTPTKKPVSQEDAIKTGEKMSKNIMDIQAAELQDRAYELLAMLPEDVQKRIKDTARTNSQMESSDDSYHYEIIALVEAEMKPSVKIDTTSIYAEFDEHYALLSVKQQQFLRNLGTDLLSKSHDSFDESNLKAAMAEILTWEDRSKAADRAREAFSLFSQHED